ncbi:MAG: hypothetical protein ACK2UL_01670 [Anaerolineae bacterium]
MEDGAGLLGDFVYWALWAVVWLAPGLVTALIAQEQGRPPLRWLIAGVVFSYAALVAVILLPNKSGAPSVSVQQWEDATERAEAVREGLTDESAETGGGSPG